MGWVFRAESYDTMNAWYEDIRALTEKSPQERNAFVRQHARSISGTSQRAGSISSDGIMGKEDGVNPYTSQRMSQDLGRGRPDNQYSAGGMTAAGLGGAAAGAVGAEAYHRYEDEKAEEFRRQQEEQAAREAATIAAPDTFEQQSEQQAAQRPPFMLLRMVTCQRQHPSPVSCLVLAAKGMLPLMEQSPQVQIQLRGFLNH